MADMNNETFSVIDPIMYLSAKRKKKRKVEIKTQPVMQYFGAEDIVINVAA